MTVPRTDDDMVSARELRNEIRCVYCNERVKGWAAMVIHEHLCPDKAAMQRQSQRALARFKRKQAGFA